MEWADDAVRILGHCALGLLEKALHDYLRDFIMRKERVSDDELSRILPKAGNWFDKYCEYLTSRTTFDWEIAPVKRSSIEQIILSRNSITHQPGINNVMLRQDEKHFQKHNVSRFADELDVTVLAGADGVPLCPAVINVTRECLFDAVEEIILFCAFVEKQLAR